MAKKSPYKQKFIQLFEQLGIEYITKLEVNTNKLGAKHNELVNPMKRALKAALNLSVEDQAQRVKMLEDAIAQVKAKREADEKALQEG